ncbi:hypothetical protein Thini_0736 [Thiothrix nivea DSM 5205]|uniref:Uncharacterized protein n=1 Tax=Thiothrix nivea (strain ATCC 35100 / DSM 5205 / JP2) TaxID=870187 RepID=A0A656HAU7_THINJ|nr:hypothetical protein Thini_0736 [Thiothrix nivea DSM 5205]
MPRTPPHLPGFFNFFTYFVGLAHRTSNDKTHKAIFKGEQGRT